MKKYIKLGILPITALFMLTACKIPSIFPRGGSNNNSNSSGQHYGDSGSATQQSGNTSTTSESGPITDWPDGLKSDLMSYLGELIPVAPFDSGTLEYGESLLGGYVIYDENDQNIFNGYGEKLNQAGYLAHLDEEGFEYYTKRVANGWDARLDCEYFEATDEYAAGNQITISFPYTANNLLKSDYVLHDGWPTDAVNEATAGGDSSLSVPSIYADDEWYVLTGLEESDYGSYNYVCLAIQGSGEADYESMLKTAGYTIEEGYATDPNAENGTEISFFEQDGFFLINIYGPYISESETITPESLVADGYVLTQGWPTTAIAEVIDGSDSTLPVPSIYADEEWYVLVDSYEDDYGEYNYVALAIEGTGATEYKALLTSAGYTFEDGENYAYDASVDNGHDIEFGEQDGFFLINVYGPYLEPDPAEAISEVTNLDGSITITFNFTSLSESTNYNGYTFASTSGSLTPNQAGGSNPPRFYETSNTLRIYYKNTVVIQAGTGYTISNVEITIGSSKTLSNTDMSASSGNVAATETGTTISNVNASSLTLTIGPNASGGNLGFSEVVVTVVGL